VLRYGKGKLWEDVAMLFYAMLYAGVAMLSLLQSYFASDLSFANLAIASAMIGFGFGGLLVRRMYLTGAHDGRVGFLHIVGITVVNVACVALGYYLEIGHAASAGYLMLPFVGVLTGLIVGTVVSALAPPQQRH
jgi:hypothetical protein